MQGDKRQAAGGYLRAVLREGAKPFLYRGRVRSLLGIPDGDKENRPLPPASPPVGFIYSRPGFWRESDAGQFSRDEGGQDKKGSREGITSEPLVQDGSFLNEAVSGPEKRAGLIEPGGRSKEPAGRIQRIRIRIPGTSVTKQEFPVLSSIYREDVPSADIEDQLQGGIRPAETGEYLPQSPALEGQDNNSWNGPLHDAVSHGNAPHSRESGNLARPSIPGRARKGKLPETHGAIYRPEKLGKQKAPDFSSDRATDRFRNSMAQAQGNLLPDQDPSGNKKPRIVDLEKNGRPQPPQPPVWLDRLISRAANRPGIDAAFLSSEEGDGLRGRQDPDPLEPAGYRAVEGSSLSGVDKIEKLRLAVREWASRKPAEQDRTDTGTSEQRDRPVLPTPALQRKVIILKSAPGRTRTRRAFWERAYLGRFHLRPLR
jgi:hypothetical protein